VTVSQRPWSREDPLCSAQAAGDYPILPEEIAVIAPRRAALALALNVH
jgi:hypothetical protein